MLVALMIKVSPNAQKQKIILDTAGSLKCFLVNQPERGKANKELIELLAERLSLSQQAIVITHGLTDKKKRVTIESNYTKENIILLLLGGIQKSII